MIVEKKNCFVPHFFFFKIEKKNNLKNFKIENVVIHPILFFKKKKKLNVNNGWFLSQIVIQYIGIKVFALLSKGGYASMP